MEELRLTFLVFGALAIAGILAHGLWTVRKQRHKESKPEAHIEHKQAESQEDSDSDFQGPSYEQELDELGLGPVRVVSREAREEPQLSTTPEPAEPDMADTDEPDIPEPPAFMLKDTPDKQEQEDAAPSPEPSQAEVATAPESAPAPDSTTEQPKPTAETPKPEISEPEAEPVTEPKGQEPKATQPKETAAPDKPQRKEPTLGEAPPSVAEPELKLETPPSAPERAASETEPQEKKSPSLAERARQGFSRSTAKGRKRRTPKVKEDQIAMDFDDQPKEEPKVAESKPAEEVPPEEQEVLVLNVRTPDGKPITGDALLPALLTLGFKFGDQDIFHRHVNSNGKGPVLFSLANMFKPGVFDIDNMEHFTTQGVSLFMILPIDGDPHQVFNMMHNAARKLADEFGAQVLDGRRSALTKQSVQQYVEKIREFERRRMIRRNR